MNRQVLTVAPAQLFRASVIGLIATAMTFAIRGDILGDLQHTFALTKTQLGWISGAAFWGFGLSILLGGPLCDAFGIGHLLKLAAGSHLAGILLTVLAPNFETLFAATVLIGLGNGLIEASVNPLIATLYKEDKTAHLIALHAGFPGGIVLGGVFAYAFTRFGLGWQAKMLLLVIPTLGYTVLFAGQHFPATERQAAGVPFTHMFRELLRPLFTVLVLCMGLTAATELGPGQWISNLFNDLLHSSSQAGILVLVWINGIMYLLRQFGGRLAHRLSPPLLIAVTAPSAAAGLWLFGHATTPTIAFAAAALLAVGVAFWWPTMLGITAERFPRGGALVLAAIGAAGSFSTALAGPVMGWINDTYGAARVLPLWAMLPTLICLASLVIHAVERIRAMNISIARQIDISREHT